MHRFELCYETDRQTDRQSAERTAALVNAEVRWLGIADYDSLQQPVGCSRRVYSYCSSVQFRSV